MVWIVGTAKPNPYNRTAWMRARVGPVFFLELACLEGSGGFWC